MNLKTSTNNIEKFEKAARLADVTITERSDFANGTSVVVLKFKRPDQLINLGMYFGLEEAKIQPKEEPKPASKSEPENDLKQGIQPELKAKEKK